MKNTFVKTCTEYSIPACLTLTIHDVNVCQTNDSFNFRIEIAHEATILQMTRNHVLIMKSNIVLIMRLKDWLKIESISFKTTSSISRLHTSWSVENQKIDHACKLFRQMSVINITLSLVAGFPRRRVGLAQLLEHEIEHRHEGEATTWLTSRGCDTRQREPCWERTWRWHASHSNWFNPSSDADYQSDQARHLFHNR